MTVFKAYDVRGTYPDQIDEALGERIGDAFVRLIGAKTLVVGRDMRSMAPSMMDAFVRGANRAGASVIDIGLASTPMTYFAIGSLGVDGGVQVTASHNPAGYIGFKFTRKDCVPVSGETGIAEMEQTAAAALQPAAATQGTVTQRDIKADYLEHVMKSAKGIKPMKIIADTANGMGGYMLQKILDRLPVDSEIIFEELDGNFPNHEADPIKVENLKWLADKVKATGADLGIAFDGDADRAVFVDEHGEPVRADFVTAAIAEDFLKDEPGATVVYDLRSSRAIAQAIKAAGGVPRRERVGHSFIKATMRDTGAVFGGELSGHYYFRENYVSDSGDLAMVTVLSILSKRGMKLSELVRPYQTLFATGEVNFRVNDPEAIMKALEKRYSDAEIDHVDGVTIQYSDWWFNVRKSNTEPLLRLNLEGNTAELCATKRAEVEALLNG